MDIETAYKKILPFEQKFPIITKLVKDIKDKKKPLIRDLINQSTYDAFGNNHFDDEMRAFSKSPPFDNYYDFQWLWYLDWIHLYAYTTSKNYQEIIRSGIYKPSSTQNVNDPLEFMPGSNHQTVDDLIKIGNRNHERFFKEMICLSRDPQSCLMWGHYANKHQGVCLGFTIPIVILEHCTNRNNTVPCNFIKIAFTDNTIKDVIYSKHRHPLNNIFTSIEEDDDDYYLMTTKGIHWEHEQETRILINGNSSSMNILNFLTDVIIGYKNEEDISSYKNHIQQHKNIKKLKFYKARPSQFGFDMDIYDEFGKKTQLQQKQSINDITRLLV